MRGSWRRLAVIVAAAFLAAPFVVEGGRQEPPTPSPGGPPPPPVRVPRAASPVRIDGVLDEAAWANAVVIPVDIEFRPGENTPAPVETACLLTYDDRALYAAFRAADPRPAEIRAHLSDRDQAHRDDNVGILLDTFNDQRRGFEFFVNPLGVQMESSVTDISGGNESEDESWDAIWESAGRITADGYEVEIAIPFTTLRFVGGDAEKVWGFAAVRNHPRSVRAGYVSMPVERTRNCWVCQWGKIVGFEGIRPGRNLELDPTVTGQRTEALADEDDITSPLVTDSTAEVGVSARWGVTPNLSLNAAVNPDFSQVEADAARLDVNTRFALFYPEKRPFFQEGADFFGTPLDAVYTRTVADPSWGVKLTGKPGAQAVGVFVARDAVTNLVFPSNQGSEGDSLDQPATAGVVRYRRDLGESSTVGVLATDREGESYANRVAGVDAVFRLGTTDSVELQLLGSRTRYPDQLAADHGQPQGEFDGSAFHLEYSHETRDWGAWLELEDLSEGFRADLGFIPRVDVRGGEAGVQRVWWREGGSWFTRIATGAEVSRVEDHTGRLTDQEAQLFLNYEGPLQSTGIVELVRAKEYFDGVTYDLDQGFFFVNVRPTGDVTCSIRVSGGDAIDYENSRPATQLRIGPEGTLNVGRHLFFGAEHELEELHVEGGRLYRANLSQLKAVYQFNVRTFVRVILHRLDVRRDPALYVDAADARTERLFAQLLFSYKINPQTVFFLGTSDTRDGTELIDMTTTNRTVFVKLGYAWLL
jgi:hypothetical protein